MSAPTVSSGNKHAGTSDTPVEVQGISDAAEVTAGRYRTCAVLPTGHVECWGENGFGQLGHRKQPATRIPPLK